MLCISKHFVISVVCFSVSPIEGEIGLLTLAQAVNLSFIAFAIKYKPPARVTISLLCTAKHSILLKDGSPVALLLLKRKHIQSSNLLKKFRGKLIYATPVSPEILSVGCNHDLNYK